MEILEVKPLRVMPPKEWASNSADVSDPDSPKADQLPPGWTVVTRINKINGSPYNVYIECDTGMKLYSLREVLDYVQNQTPDRLPDKIFSAKTAPRGHPIWLPPDWDVEIKMKMSGTSAGQKYKVYVEKSTGKKLYSLRQVFNYLKFRSSSPEIENVQTVRPENYPDWLPQDLSVQTDDESSDGDNTAEREEKVKKTMCENPNWLPPDWAVEIKMKMSGFHAGQRYKVYIEKSTGKKLYSQRQVFDYLKRFRSSSPEIDNVHTVRPENHPDWLPQNRCAQTENGSDDTAEGKDKAKVTDTDSDGLPQGWFKAIRYRETRISGIRSKVAFYVDPLSGYAFFSTKDAHRYIDSGSIEGCRVKPRRWSEVSTDTPGNKFYSKPTSVKEELNSEDRKGKRPLFTEKSYGGPSEEDIIEIEDSDEESESILKENTQTKPLFSEDNCCKKSENVIETDDVPKGAGKRSTNESEKEKIPQTPPPRRMRVKVLASKPKPFHHYSKPTSPIPLTTDSSNACPMQTNLRSNGENPEPKHKKQMLEKQSSQQVASEVIDRKKTEVAPCSLHGQSSLDSCLEFAINTLTEDIMDLDKKKCVAIFSKKLDG